MGMIDWDLGPGFLTRIFGFVDFFDLGAEAREGGAHSGGCSLLVAGRRRELGVKRPSAMDDRRLDDVLCDRRRCGFPLFDRGCNNRRRVRATRNSSCPQV